MKISGLLDFLDDVTDAVKRFTPIATEFGIPLVEKLGNMADTAVDIAKNALNRVEDAREVINSEDKADIEQRIAELDAVNEELHQRVLNT